MFESQFDLPADAIEFQHFLRRQHVWAERGENDHELGQRQRLGRNFLVSLVGLASNLFLCARRGQRAFAQRTDAPGVSLPALFEGDVPFARPAFGQLAQVRLKIERLPAWGELRKNETVEPHQHVSLCVHDGLDSGPMAVTPIGQQEVPRLDRNAFIAFPAVLIGQLKKITVQMRQA